ncbi:MAG: T9SS type A sorting domain-containing protein [Sphingobacteriales bacterium]|nr:T9SS type A sorting domain-containing protein [Sphingobacteriales bacterium]
MSTRGEASNTVIPENLTIKLIEIIDMTGKICYRRDCRNLENGSLIIPVNNLRNGVYLMKIFNGQQWSVEKIIVQH